VKNQLYWSLDVIFGEDQSRKRIRNAAQNFSTIRKMALNLLKAQPEKISVNRKGNIPVPVHLELEYTDGSKQTIHRTASVWRDGKQNLRVPCDEGKTLKSAKLGATTIPDVDKKDNSWGR